MSTSDEKFIKDMLDLGMSTPEILAIFSAKGIIPERYEFARMFLGLDETAE
jgi:hypothetical protein